MSDYPIDVHYACLQLGLPDGGHADQATAVLRRAEAYRFVSKERLKTVRRLAVYFTARQQLGAPDESFSKLRKSYYKMAMALHPDRGAAGKTDEDELKNINAAYELVEAVYREAQHYFRQDETTRAEIEQTAQYDRQCEVAGKPQAKAGEAETTSAGAEAAPPQPQTTTSAPRGTHTRPRAAPLAPGAVRFCAASVPRYIRNARLPHLGRDAVIGSRLFQTKSGQSLVYDIIMLAEPDFMRAKLLLSLTAGQNSSYELSMSKMTPAYMPMDTKVLLVAAGQTNPWHFARAHFLQAFGLDQS